ncbi:archaellin/type IV pilin N-terminal domain-containing protein [Halorubrum sp. CBA1229]|uniref:archaellin/type IV pilin N-terminal domain-containing protein n=1 Tax=Halorubrum sp. CBA1229 TaxID=1853699 RepID=UPI000F3F707E|nr:archaellin/type IV pilin N-terminal domain-containing protein [Halorubrum sp. CBA1229]QKY16783.1 flagellin [Halorubrum sp. CBA1229]
MFEFINNSEDRGQVGIGTLIVFIAMVLVAAIAAGVLINTAGFLQSQAEATGQESTDLVSERIDVSSEVGIVGNASSGELEEIRVSVSGAAGSSQIDLSETTIQAVGPNGQANLVFTDEAANGTTLDSSYNASYLNQSEFGVQNSSGAWVAGDDAVLNGEEDYTIVLNPGAEPFGSLTSANDSTGVRNGDTFTFAHLTSDEAFGQSDTSSLEIVSPSSATTSVELNSPDLYSEDGEAVRL